MKEPAHLTFGHQPQDVVIKNGEVTLEALFKSTGIPIENFTLDSLDTHSNHTTYGRFDKFNSKYNPFGTATTQACAIQNVRCFLTAPLVGGAHRLVRSANALPEEDERHRWPLLCRVAEGGARPTREEPPRGAPHSLATRQTHSQQLLMSVFFFVGGGG